MSRSSLPKLVGLLAAGLLSFPSAAKSNPSPAPGDSAEVAKSVPSEGQLPTGHRISSVPFVGWGEAAGWTYPHNDVLNPSYPACLGMVFEYWGQDRRLVESLAASMTPEGWVSEGMGDSADIARLRELIAKDLPVIVTGAITPLGHPLAGAAESGLAMGFIEVEGVEPPGPYSNALGKFVTLEGHRALQEAMNLNPIRESLTLSARVVVGYDDSRQVLTFHDPTFGPGWEMGYSDFERTWLASACRYVVTHPTGTTLPARAAETALPAARTAEQLAMEAYVYGYALASAGDLEGGEGRFRQALALSGVSPGCRFLCLFELALTLEEGNRHDEAVAAAEEATRILPDHPLPWSFLQQVYSKSSVQDKKKKAKEAGKRAEQIGKNRQALTTAALALPCDIWIMNCADLRGWCRPATAGK